GNPFKELHYKFLLVTEALRPCFRWKDASAASVARLEALVHNHREMIHHSSKHKHRENSRNLTPLQFLSEMRPILVAENSQLRLDYISLTKTCYKLMKQIYAEIKATCGVDYPLQNGEDTREPLYSIMTIEILHDSKEKQGGRSKGQCTNQSPWLEAVTSVLKGYLDIRARVVGI
ncbi:hypothetical protein BDZ45DRAFT_608538, partial [Acephala macrosclerotiorum]